MIFEIKRIDNGYIIKVNSNKTYLSKEYCLPEGNDLIEFLINQIKPTIKEVIGKIDLPVNGEVCKIIKISKD